MPNPKRGDFWVFNITRNPISLADLRVKIPAHGHLNLLSGNNRWTEEELLISAQSGSLFDKRDKLRISRVAPRFDTAKFKQPPVDTELRITQLRSAIQDEEEMLPELELTENLIPEDEEDIVEKNIKKA